MRWLGGACGLEETVPHLQGQLPLSHEKPETEIWM